MFLAQAHDTISPMFNIVKAPNPILRNPTRLVKKITPKYLQIIDQMIATTKSFQDPEGIGLAATQVGIAEQFFIAKFDLDLKEKVKPNQNKDQSSDSLAKTSLVQFPEDFTAVFNPRINWGSKRVKITMEGCLSIPDYYSPISRPSYIKVSYIDKNGQLVHKSLKGMNATIFQHEYDHLHGKLFMDYVIAQKTKLFKITGKDSSGADIYQEVSL